MVVVVAGEVDILVWFSMPRWASCCARELVERRRSAALRPGVPHAPRAAGGVVGWTGGGGGEGRGGGREERGGGGWRFC